MRMAAVDYHGQILYRTKCETPKSGKAEKILHSIGKAAKKCSEFIGNKYQIEAIGVAVPATVDAERGITLKAPNLPCLDGFRMVAALENELNLKAIIENDANAAAIGEAWLGASKDYKNSIMVTLGTGVGGGVIIDGKPLRGVDGTAGEVGHICVEPFGEPCGCGSRGCVEQYSSATAIVRLTRELESQYPKSVLQNKLCLTSSDVYEAGKKGDELAIEVFRQMGFYLGIALANLVNVLNTEIIVIGGGVSAGWDLFIQHVKEQILSRAFREPAQKVKLKRSMLGDDAGILGGAELAFERIS